MTVKVVLPEARARLALLLGAVWLLVAATVNAAGAGALGICFAALAVLWIWIAAFESRNRRRRLPATALREIRWQAAPSPG